MKAKQTHPNYAAEVRYFVTSACRQRLMLLRTGKSKSDNPRLYDIAKGLEYDVQMVQADVQAASFLNRRSGDILALLPGKDCKSIKTRIQKFNDLYYKAKTIMQCAH